MANPGHVEGEGSAGDKFRVSGTQETVEGAGANEVSGVLSEVSCCRCGAPLIKKTSREPMCPGVLSGGVRGARWTQIDAIAGADVPWRPVEWRLPCQMNCSKVWDRALTAVRGSSETFLQNIARADMPWSDVWRG